MKAKVKVLYRDPRWLALEKPAGMLTVPSGGGARDEDTLYERARRIAGNATHHHALSRLDAGVTGVVVFALSAEAIERANNARARSLYRRTYHALLPGAPTPPRGTWDAPIGIDPRNKTHRLAGAGDELRAARTDYDVRAVTPSGVACVELSLVTGRTHQVRVHARAAGQTLLGDDAYGGARRVVLDDGTVVSVGRVMLHAARVELTGEDVEFECPWADDMTAVWRECGGEALGLFKTPA